jgi:hypothetical protein
MDHSEGSAFKRVSPLRGGMSQDSIVDQESILRTSISAEKLSDKFLSTYVIRTIFNAKYIGY